jgi:hypothetical protein
MNKLSYSKIEIEEIVAMERLYLYNRGLPCGAKAILQEMESQGVYPLPSQRSIARILDRLGLTHRRTGHYP